MLSLTWNSWLLFCCVFLVILMVVIAGAALVICITVVFIGIFCLQRYTVRSHNVFYFVLHEILLFHYGDRDMLQISKNTTKCCTIFIPISDVRVTTRNRLVNLQSKKFSTSLHQFRITSNKQWQRLRTICCSLFVLTRSMFCWTKFCSREMLFVANMEIKLMAEWSAVIVVNLYLLAHFIMASSGCFCTHFLLHLYLFCSLHAIYSCSVCVHVWYGIRLHSYSYN